MEENNNEIKYDADYGETYRRLLNELALVAFIKSNKRTRFMLATRNLRIANLMWPDNNLKYLLNGFDYRCNIHNKNLAVIDLMIGDCRSFNTDRVTDIRWLGEITDINTLNNILEQVDNICTEASNNLGYSVLGGNDAFIKKPSIVSF